jgi:ubiquinone/menaquinone biosynthesis C-methylase UbiE
MKKTNTIYDTGEYLARNPTYNQEDAKWKATQVIRILKINNIQANEICEVGCGSGEILNQMNNNYSSKASYTGYDISPYAIDIAKQREKDNIHFFHEDFILSQNTKFDAILVLDVVEHVENYIDFLKELKEKGEYKIFHIPLEMSCRHVLFSQSVLIKYRFQYGHLHHFSKDTAIETLKYCGYEIIDSFYTNKIDNIQKLGKRLLYAPVQLSYFLFPELTVKLIGGFGLLVLAK